MLHTFPLSVASSSGSGWYTMLDHMNTSVVHQHSLLAICWRSFLASGECQISGKLFCRRLPIGLWISHTPTSPCMSKFAAAAGALAYVIGAPKEKTSGVLHASWSQPGTPPASRMQD